MKTYKKLMLAAGAFAIMSGFVPEKTVAKSGLETRVTIEHSIEKSDNGFRFGKIYDTGRNFSLSSSLISYGLNNSSLAIPSDSKIFDGYSKSGFNIEKGLANEVVNSFIDGLRDVDNFMEIYSNNANTEIKALTSATFLAGQLNYIYNNSDSKPIRDNNKKVGVYKNSVLYKEENENRLNCVGIARAEIDFINLATDIHGLNLKAWGEKVYSGNGIGHFISLVRDRHSGKIYVLDGSSVLNPGTKEPSEALALAAKGKRKRVLDLNPISDNGFYYSRTKIQEKTELAVSPLGILGEDFGSEMGKVLKKDERELKSGFDVNLSRFDNKIEFSYEFLSKFSPYVQFREARVFEYGGDDVGMTLLKTGIRGRNWSFGFSGISIESTGVQDDNILGAFGYFQDSVPLYSSSDMDLSLGYASQFSQFKKAEEYSFHVDLAVDLAAKFKNGIYFSNGFDFENIDARPEEYFDSSTFPSFSYLSDQKNYRLSQARASTGFAFGDHDFSVFWKRRFSDTRALDTLFDDTTIKYGIGGSFSGGVEYFNRIVDKEWNDIYPNIEKVSVKAGAEVFDGVIASLKYSEQNRSYGKHKEISNGVEVGLEGKF